MLTPSRLASGHRFGRGLLPVAGPLAISLSLLTGAVAAEPPGGASAMLIPASLQPADTAAPAAPLVGDPEIRSRLDTGAGLVIAGERLHASLLRQFYAMHNYDRVWPTRQAQADALLRGIMRAEEHGLDPELFHAALLRNPTSLSPIDRELLLSDAFLGYADALARGALPVEQRMDDEDLNPGSVDVVGTVERAINSPDPSAVVETLAPQMPAYKALQRALASSRIPAEPTAAALRGRPPQHAASEGSETRLKKIIVNLERLRWLPRTLPADRVWVNTANAELVLYRENRPVFRTRVVVGETDKQTPELQATITGVLFNPPWNIPRSIASTEILPRAARDPAYLARHHMVYRSNGALQQLPGPQAALGQLKFEMPNRFDVYLHDTPMKNLFTRDNRRQSHGCVRVQNPRELAALLLDQSVDAINKSIGISHTHARGLPSAIPVFFVYQTAFVDDNGAIEFRPDFYERDAEIWEHLHPARQAPVAQREPLTQRRG